jgi:PEP-CTERM motif
MKKLILTAIGLVAGATLVHAQGYMVINGASAGVTTNTSSYFAQGAGTTGLTAKGAAVYDYAVLVSTTPITDGPTDAGWSQVGTFAGSTPIVAGGSGLSQGAVIGQSANQFESDIAVGTYYVAVVGWSPGLGSSWSTVETELAGGFSAFQGLQDYFGYTYSGTADFVTAASSPGDNCFGVTGVANGSLVLYNVTAVPEPATLALAGLGGLSMLFLRRRKA